MSTVQLAAVQFLTKPVHGPDDRPVLMANAERAAELAGKAAWMGANVVVLPEFFLTFYRPGRTVQQHIEQVCIEIPGPETEVICRAAKELGIYIAGASLEYDPAWPDRYFNCGWVAGPSGTVELKYRKHSDLIYMVPGMSLNDTTPGDVYDEYINRYGEESLFPVLKTPFGNLGVLVCYDCNFPEVSRCLAMNGAEILLHPTEESRGSADSWNIYKAARAKENNVYWVSANSAGPTCWGGSQIRDIEGRLLKIEPSPGESIIMEPVSLDLLRERKQSMKSNYIPQLRAGLYGREYLRQAGKLFPNNGWLESPLVEQTESTDKKTEIIAGLTADGTFVAPTQSSERVPRV